MKYHDWTDTLRLNPAGRKPKALISPMSPDEIARKRRIERHEEERRLRLSLREEREVA